MKPHRMVGDSDPPFRALELSIWVGDQFGDLDHLHFLSAQN
jgi:hypothetical protein